MADRRAGGFDGAVLTGGASRRMGRDKATLAVDGAAMAVRVAQALREAGAARVATIGLAVPGEEHVADLHPGEGPLGGALTALAWSRAPVVVVAPCDLLTPSSEAFALLAAALVADRASGPLAASAGPARPLPVALRATAAPALADAFAAGERSLHRALAALAPLAVEVAAAALADADTPDDLPPGAG